MIKKIFLFMILIISVFSCGKKGDPEYKTSKIIDTKSIVINKT